MEKKIRSGSRLLLLESRFTQIIELIHSAIMNAAEKADMIETKLLNEEGSNIIINLR